LSSQASQGRSSLVPWTSSSL